MVFMILAVFIFFILVGIFFLTVQMGGIRDSAAQLQKEQAISSIQVISDMPELSFDPTETMTIDEDKLRIMSGSFGDAYDSFWPVVSVEVYKIYPGFGEIIEYPLTNYNYYNVYDSGQASSHKESGFISLCEKRKEAGSVFDRCEIAKLVVGVKIYE